MNAVYTILLLVLSNTFMTLAWYGHLKFKEMEWFEGLFILHYSNQLGHCIFEYIFQVPANRMGFKATEVTFRWSVKVIQEVITLTVFVIFTLLVFKTESFRMNHVIGFIFLVLAVYFIFKK